MIWTQHPNHLLSDCGNYKITNVGKPGGKKYCLWGKHYGHFCRLITMGTLEEVKERAEGYAERN